jgi:sulfate transport system ATP-binding protein
MEMADRVAVLRAGRIEQVDAPDKLYAEPASPFVHEFLGESVRLDCTVVDGLAKIEGLEGAMFATDCPSGPAIALIRPHDIGLYPETGPARVDSVHRSGSMHRLRIMVGDQMLEVLRPLDAWTPAAADTCRIDLTRARIYALDR